MSWNWLIQILWKKEKIFSISLNKSHIFESCQCKKDKSSKEKNYSPNRKYFAYNITTFLEYCPILNGTLNFDSVEWRETGQQTGMSRKTCDSLKRDMTSEELRQSNDLLIASSPQLAALIHKQTQDCQTSNSAKQRIH